jgi:hypothetical protein
MTFPTNICMPGLDQIGVKGHGTLGVSGIGCLTTWLLGVVWYAATDGVER